MSFQIFVKPAGAELMDSLSDPENLVRHAPELAVKFDAIKELRSLDDGTLSKGNGFRRVASLLAPLDRLMQCLDPDFMKEKRNFYRWLDSGNNRAYCTYDRRSAADRQAQFERDFGHMMIGGPNGGLHEPESDHQAAGSEKADREPATQGGFGGVPGQDGSVWGFRPEDSQEAFGQAERPSEVLGGQNGDQLFQSPTSPEAPRNGPLRDAGLRSGTAVPGVYDGRQEEPGPAERRAASETGEVRPNGRDARTRIPGEVERTEKEVIKSTVENT